MSMGMVVLIRVASALAGAIIGLLLIKLWASRPCWLRGHDRKHLSIEVRVWQSNCPNHFRWHGTQGIPANCYVTKWVCAKCGDMGFFCAGEQQNGAWTIEHGKIVPDEKAWAQWDKKT